MGAEAEGHHLPLFSSVSKTCYGVTTPYEREENTMSTTLNRPTETQTHATWPQPPINLPSPMPPAITQLDRTILLAMHAAIAFGLIVTAPTIPATPDARVFIDLAVLAFIATPGIVMAALNVPHRNWWAAAAPLVSAAYLWLPSITSGSVYADADLISIIMLAGVAPLLSVFAPFILLGRSNAQPWTLAGYGFAVIAAPAVVYAALAYPLIG